MGVIHSHGAYMLHLVISCIFVEFLVVKRKKYTGDCKKKKKPKQKQKAKTNQPKNSKEKKPQQQQSFTQCCVFKCMKEYVFQLLFHQSKNWCPESLPLRKEQP